jgi:hypothetical protein
MGKEGQALNGMYSVEGSAGEEWERVARATRGDVRKAIEMPKDTSALKTPLTHEDQRLLRRPGGDLGLELPQQLDVHRYPHNGLRLSRLA